MKSKKSLWLKIGLASLALLGVACYGYYSGYMYPEGSYYTPGYYYQEPAQPYYSYYHRTCYACHYDYYWDPAWEVGFYYYLWHRCSYRTCADCYDPYWFQYRSRYYNKQYYTYNPNDYHQIYKQYQKEIYDQDKAPYPEYREKPKKYKPAYESVPPDKDPWYWMQEQSNRKISERKKIEIQETEIAPMPEWFNKEGFIPWSGAELEKQEKQSKTSGSGRTRR